MRFVICGAGAIGGVLGGQLAKAGFAVLFIEPMQEHATAICTHGLQLKGIHGQHTVSIPVVQHASQVEFHPEDVIILAVKSGRCADAVAALRRATPLEVPVFCAQNGVTNEDVVARAFRQVNGLMVLIGAKCLAPGEVIQTGNGPLGIGTHPAGLSPVAGAVAAALDQTDLPVYTTHAIGRAKWYKLLLNLNTATLGLTGLATQEAAADAAARAWMADVWEEGVCVSQAAGRAYAGPAGLPTIEEHLQTLRLGAAPAEVPSAEDEKGRSSLWQDLYHRRGAVEADYLNGEIVRLGQHYGVPTPYNHLLLTLSNAAAQARALPGQYTIAQLRALLPG
jgi:2-dehydropantoate 2-reductase